MSAIKNSSFFWLCLVSFASFAQSPAFDIKGAGEICRNKSEFYKIEVDDNFPCDLKNVVWKQKDENGNFQWIGGGKSIYISPSIHYPDTQRTFQIDASVSCDVETVDENGNTVVINQGFSEVKTIKIVDPKFFELSISGSIECNSTGFNLHLLDPGGHLGSSNIAQISWDVPPVWTIASGQGTQNLAINTNSNAEGQRTVKVSYSAFAVKFDNNNNPIFKKCGDKTEIAINLDIGSCRLHIPYAQHPNHYSSHSSSNTVFNGNITLTPDNYNFVSGGYIEIESDFEFQANQGSDLNLFIEPCGCNSPWHDPNLMGESSFNISEHMKGKWGGHDFNEQSESNGSIPVGSEGNTTDIKVFPTPFNHLLKVSGLPTNTDLEIQLLGADGRRIYETRENSDDSGYLSLKIDRLETGLYFLVLRFDNRVEFSQIVKK